MKKNSASGLILALSGVLLLGMALSDCALSSQPQAARNR
jgi:hypothetical protein